MAKLPWILAAAAIALFASRRRKGGGGGGVGDPPGSYELPVPEPVTPTPGGGTIRRTSIAIRKPELPKAVIVDLPDVYTPKVGSATTTTPIPGAAALVAGNFARMQADLLARQQAAMIKSAYPTYSPIAPRVPAPSAAAPAKVQVQRPVIAETTDFRITSTATSPIPDVQLDESRYEGFKKLLDSDRDTRELYGMLGGPSGLFSKVGAEWKLREWAKSYERNFGPLPQTTSEAYQTMRTVQYSEDAGVKHATAVVKSETKARIDAEQQKARRAEEQEKLDVASRFEAEKAYRLQEEERFDREQNELKKLQQAEEAERNRRAEVQSRFAETFDMRTGLLRPEAYAAADWEKRFGTPFPVTFEQREEALRNAKALLEIAAQREAVVVEQYRAKAEKQLQEDLSEQTKDLADSIKRLREELRKERLAEQGYIGESSRDIRKRNYINSNLQQFYSSRITEEATSSAGVYDHAKAQKLTAKYANELARKFDKLNPDKVAPTYIGVTLADDWILGKIRDGTLDSSKSAFIDDISKYRSKFGEYTPDSATRMLFGWAGKMAENLQLNPSELAKMSAQFVGEMVRDKEQSAIARAYLLANDSTIDSKERVDRLVELARTLNAARAEIASEHAPRAMEKIAKEKGLAFLFREFKKRMGPGGGAPVAAPKATSAFAVDGIDDIAALEFGSRRHKRG